MSLLTWDFHMQVLAEQFLSPCLLLISSNVMIRAQFPGYYFGRRSRLLEIGGSRYGSATVQQSGPEQRTPGANLLIWLRKTWYFDWTPVFAVVLAMVAGIIVIMITSPGFLGDRFTEASAPISPLKRLFRQPAESLVYFGECHPAHFAGLSVAIAFVPGF